MKNFKFLALLLAIFGMALLPSCNRSPGEKPRTDYENLIIGTWKNDRNDEHKRYSRRVVTPPIEELYDKEGERWNPGEDIHPGDSGTIFYWYLRGNQIMEAHPRDPILGGYDNRIWTITEITSSRLVYTFGARTESFTKQ